MAKDVETLAGADLTDFGNAVRAALSASRIPTSPPHRRWRLFIQTINGGGYMSLGELRFGQAAHTGGTASASSFFSSERTAAQAFDGDPATLWMNGGATTNEWIGYQFSADVAVEAVTLTANTDAGRVGQMPNSFKVQSSDDGVTWADEWAVTGAGAWTAGEARTFVRPVIPIAEPIADFNTAEHLTGAKWIDGKPIYRRVVNLGAMPNAATKNVAHGITGLGQVVNIRGVIKNATTYFPLPQVTSADVWQVEIGVDATNVVLKAGMDMSTFSGAATVEYTKL